jgi:IclR family pca regulon transcriptional regulator
MERAGAVTVDDKARSTGFVQSLERGLAVIRVFDAAHPERTLSEVARATGLTRAAARRFLHTLVDLGYMRTDGRLFSLRPRVLELGYAYLSGLTLTEIALPHMEALVAQVHESCSVSVLDGEDVVYVARVPTKRIMTVAINVGTRFPAYATSMGRVMLAAQPQAWIDSYLAATAFISLTPSTVTDAKRLATVLRQFGRRRDEHLDPRQPWRRRGCPARAAAAAAGSRGGGRSGSGWRPDDVRPGLNDRSTLSAGGIDATWVDPYLLVQPVNMRSHCEQSPTLVRRWHDRE